MAVIAEARAAVAADVGATNPELEQLQLLYQLMLDKGLDAVELKDEDSRIRLTRRWANPTGTAHAGHPAPGTLVVPVVAGSEGAPNAAQLVCTPLAGVFYRASSPTSVPFAKEGDTADPGQTLCIVEAMKVMNEIKAESRCRIVKIVAENGRPVTAGQTLFQIEPA